MSGFIILDQCVLEIVGVSVIHEREVSPLMGISWLVYSFTGVFECSVVVNKTATGICVQIFV